MGGVGGGRKFDECLYGKVAEIGQGVSEVVADGHVEPAAGLDAACDEAEGPNASSSNGFTMFATGTVNPSIVPTDAWSTPYTMIRAVNQFLGHLYEIPFNATLKAETRAEARFLRAWYYFIMLEHYGGVPLIG